MKASHELQLFQPHPRTAYPIEITARIADVGRHTILVYCKRGMVSTVIDPGDGGYYFDEEAIRTLRRIQHLRNVCGVNLAGIKMILGLMDEVERLGAEVRFLHRARI